MTTAFFCVFIAILLPVIWVAIAKAPLIKSKEYDNAASRPQLEKLSGSSQRAKWAEQNSYEALPGFIAAVIIASLANAEQATIDLLAMVHVLARIAYGICYIKDMATARSLVWFVGFGAMVGLFVAGF